MRERESAGRIGVVVACVLISGACSKERQAAPDLQTSTSVPQAPQAITVTGCLKEGTLADNTWVLIAADAGAGATAQPSTYQLVGGDVDSLRTSVDRQVEVSGTVEADQQVASDSGVVKEHPATGTSGTPQVETKTDVEVKRLQVSTVKPTGNGCK